MSFWGLILFLATIMALNAVSIDAMLPALPEIRRSFGIAEANKVQWVVTGYLLGLGGAQLIYGPLADGFGRRPVLLFGIAIYTIASLGAVFASSLEALVVFRVVQGFGAAAMRVLTVAIVRDRYSGAQMARVMSFIFTVFLVSPLLAPSIGYMLVLFLSWHWIFALFSLWSLFALLWGYRRLPETLRLQDRSPISASSVVDALWKILTARLAVGYMLAVTLLFGCLFSFINCAQQIFSETFDTADLFSVVFSGIAACMLLSSALNSHIVGVFGPRVVSHWALLGLTGFSALLMLAPLAGHESVWWFVATQSGVMFCFGLLISNFNVLAMEPLDQIAGTASSVIGFVSTTGGALLGLLVGQKFDGTTLPLGVGLFVFSLLTFGCVLFAEKGRLFWRYHYWNTSR